MMYNTLKLNAVGLYVGAVFGTAAFTYLSIRGLIMSRASNTKTKPLQHLKLLNYQPRSISSISSNLPMNVHSRCY
ncbi:hypothetical protein AB4K20DRAFT_1885101, partial [Rhizopus microsporus]